MPDNKERRNISWHLPGSFHYAAAAGCGFWQSLLLVSVPYLVKDILSVAGAFAAARILRKTAGRAGISF